MGAGKAEVRGVRGRRCFSGAFRAPSGLKILLYMSLCLLDVMNGLIT